jgi:hypothetical protein
VKPIDLEGLEKLPLASFAANTWKDTRKWVCDDDSYKHVTFAGKLERSRLSAEDERRMQQLGLIRELDASETPTGTTRLFWVAEQAKGRRRPIRWTKAINEALGRDTLRGMKMATRAEQVAQSLTGQWAICLDMSAWFDQIPLALDVQLRHCFIGRDGKIYCLTRLPMGQRQAVDVAVSITRLLLNFELPAGVTAQDCIDNVRFCGSREGVIEAALSFVQRCRLIGVTLNEVPLDRDPRETLAELAHQEGDWLGARYSYSNKTVKLSSKTIDKLKFAQQEAKQVLHAKNLASVFGLLFFASSVIDLCLAKRFTVLQFFRRFSSEVSANNGLWNAHVRVPDIAFRDLMKWIDDALVNVPRPIFDWSQQPSKYLFTDASAWGWGGILVDTLSGTVQHHSEPWKPSDPVNISHSVETEPEGAYRALCRFIPVTLPTGTRIELVTDSITTRAIVTKTYSGSLAVNRVGLFLAKFSHLAISATHIPGVENPADEISRGLQWSEKSEILIRKSMGFEPVGPPNVKHTVIEVP